MSLIKNKIFAHDHSASLRYFDVNMGNIDILFDRVDIGILVDVGIFLV